MERVLEAESAFGHSGRSKLVHFRKLRVCIRQTFDELAREFLQRSRGAGGRRLLDDEVYIVDVSVVKGGEDGALVGKVLIERADADAGGLGDAIRGHSLGSVALYHKLDRLKHVVHGLP